MDAELKRRDQNLEEALKQRDDEWKSIWELREQEMSEEHLMWKSIMFSKATLI